MERKFLSRPGNKLAAETVARTELNQINGILQQAIRVDAHLEPAVQEILQQDFQSAVQGGANIVNNPSHPLFHATAKITEARQIQWARQSQLTVGVIGPSPSQVKSLIKADRNTSDGFNLAHFCSQARNENSERAKQFITSSKNNHEACDVKSQEIITGMANCEPVSDLLCMDGGHNCTKKFQRAISHHSIYDFGPKAIHNYFENHFEDNNGIIHAVLNLPPCLANFKPGNPTTFTDPKRGYFMHISHEVQRPFCAPEIVEGFAEHHKYVGKGGVPGIALTGTSGPVLFPTTYSPAFVSFGFTDQPNKTYRHILYNWQLMLRCNFDHMGHAYRIERIVTNGITATCLITRISSPELYITDANPVFTSDVPMVHFFDLESHYDTNKTIIDSTIDFTFLPKVKIEKELFDKTLAHGLVREQLITVEQLIQYANIKRTKIITSQNVNIVKSYDLDNRAIQKMAIFIHNHIKCSRLNRITSQARIDADMYLLLDGSNLMQSIKLLLQEVFAEIKIIREIFNLKKVGEGLSMSCYVGVAYNVVRGFLRITSFIEMIRKQLSAQRGSFHSFDGESVFWLSFNTSMALIAAFVGRILIPRLIENYGRRARDFGFGAQAYEKLFTYEEKHFHIEYNIAKNEHKVPKIGKNNEPTDEEKLVYCEILDHVGNDHNTPLPAHLLDSYNDYQKQLRERKGALYECSQQYETLKVERGVDILTQNQKRLADVLALKISYKTSFPSDRFDGLHNREVLGHTRTWKDMLIQDTEISIAECVDKTSNMRVLFETFLTALKFHHKEGDNRKNMVHLRSPPGGGKSTLVAKRMKELESNIDFILVVVPMNNCKKAWKKRLAGKKNVSVRTTHNWVTEIDKITEKSIIIVDECSVLPVPMLSFIAQFAPTLLIGDDQQIKDIDFHKVYTTAPRVSELLRTLPIHEIEVSHRMPQDISDLAFMQNKYNKLSTTSKIKLSLQYFTLFDFFGGTNESQKGLKACADNFRVLEHCKHSRLPDYDGCNCVGQKDHYKYLTFTQATKDFIASFYSSTKGIYDINFNSVHEDMGETYKNVILVQTQSDLNNGYGKKAHNDGHLVEGISRHTDNLIIVEASEGSIRRYLNITTAMAADHERISPGMLTRVYDPAHANTVVEEEKPSDREVPYAIMEGADEKLAFEALNQIRGFEPEFNDASLINPMILQDFGGAHISISEHSFMDKMARMCVYKKTLMTWIDVEHTFPNVSKGLYLAVIRAFKKKQQGLYLNMVDKNKERIRLDDIADLKAYVAAGQDPGKPWTHYNQVDIDTLVDQVIKGASRGFDVPNTSRDYRASDPLLTVRTLVGRYSKVNQQFDDEAIDYIANELVDRLAGFVDLTEATDEEFTEEFTLAAIRAHERGHDVNSFGEIEGDDGELIHAPSDFVSKTQIKSDWQNPNAKGKFKVAQGVSAWQKSTNFLVAAVSRILENRLSGFMLTRTTDREALIILQEKIRQTHQNAKEQGKGVFYKAFDLDQCDTGFQKIDAKAVSITFLKLGLEQQIERHVEKKMHKRRTIARGILIAIIEDMLDSGCPFTLGSNSFRLLYLAMSLLGHAAFKSAVEHGFIFVKGDDLLICTLEPEFDFNSFDLMAQHFDVKFTVENLSFDGQFKTSAEFISFIVAGMHVGMNIPRFAAKLIDMKFLSAKRFSEYIVAVNDRLKCHANGHEVHSAITANKHYFEMTEEAPFDTLWSFIANFAAGKFNYLDLEYRTRETRIVEVTDLNYERAIEADVLLHDCDERLYNPDKEVPLASTTMNIFNGLIDRVNGHQLHGGLEPVCVPAVPNPNTVYPEIPIPHFLKRLKIVYSLSVNVNLLEEHVHELVQCPIKLEAIRNVSKISYKNGCVQLTYISKPTGNANMDVHFCEFKSVEILERYIISWLKTGVARCKDDSMGYRIEHLKSKAAMQAVDYIILPTHGDGHCMMNSIFNASKDPHMNVQKFKSKLKSKPEWYRNVIPDMEMYQMDLYFENKECNSNFADLIFDMILLAYPINLYILDSEIDVSCSPEQFVKRKSDIYIRRTMTEGCAVAHYDSYIKKHDKYLTVMSLKKLRKRVNFERSFYRLMITAGMCLHLLSDVQANLNLNGTTVYNNSNETGYDVIHGFTENRYLFKQPTLFEKITWAPTKIIRSKALSLVKSEKSIIEYVPPELKFCNDTEFLASGETGLIQNFVHVPIRTFDGLNIVRHDHIQSYPSTFVHPAYAQQYNPELLLSEGAKIVVPWTLAFLYIRQLYHGRDRRYSRIRDMVASFAVCKLIIFCFFTLDMQTFALLFLVVIAAPIQEEIIKNPFIPFIKTKVYLGSWLKLNSIIKMAACLGFGFWEFFMYKENLEAQMVPLMVILSWRIPPLIMHITPIFKKGGFFTQSSLSKNIVKHQVYNFMCATTIWFAPLSSYLRGNIPLIACDDISVNVIPPRSVYERCLTECESTYNHAGYHSDVNQERCNDKCREQRQQYIDYAWDTYESCINGSTSNVVSILGADAKVVPNLDYFSNSEFSYKQIIYNEFNSTCSINNDFDGTVPYVGACDATRLTYMQSITCYAEHQLIVLLFALIIMFFLIM